MGISNKCTNCGAPLSEAIDQGFEIVCSYCGCKHKSPLITIKVGDRVLGNWCNYGKYYPGTVTQIQGSLIFIKYDDGDEEWAEATSVQRPNMGKVQLKVGDRVLGNWQGRQVFYPGVIDKINGSQYHIKYDDGDKEWTTTQFIHLLTDPPVIEPAPSAYNESNKNSCEGLKIGDRVQGNWKGQGRLYPGVITKINGNLIHIHYDDGDEEWTTPENVIKI